ncbi:MAG: acyltransferase [Candidatus Diapherotrites archaeon]
MRIAVWDSIKGFAIFSIVIYHFHSLINPHSLFEILDLFNYSFPEFISFLSELSFPEQILSYGFQGVGIFLVFSGAGLTYSALLTNKKLVLKDWFFRRFMRIFPAYWLAIIFTVIFFPVVRQTDLILHSFALNIFFRELFFFPGNSSLWFIGLLVQAYLFFLILFHLGKKFGFTNLFAVSFLVSVITRILLLSFILDFNEYLFISIIFSRLAEFSLGLLLASEWLKNPEKVISFFSNKKIFVVSLLGYIVFDLFYFGWFLAFEFIATISLVFFLLFVFLFIQKRIVFLSKFFIFLSKYSLWIFLIHYPILVLFQGFFVQHSAPAIIGFFVAFLIILPIAIVLTKLTNNFVKFIVAVFL